MRDLSSRIYQAIRRRTILRLQRFLQTDSLYRSGVLDHGVSLSCQEDQVFLAIVAIIRGESDFLREWIEFHRMMGVEHFVIYDNGGDEATREALEPYLAAGVVTQIPWPDLDELRKYWRHTDSVSIQELAYGNCLRMFGDRFEWLLKIDVDEFVYPANPDHQSVSSVLGSSEAEDWMGLNIPMRNFGSSGHVKRPEGLVIENYTRCEKQLSPGVKGVARCRFAESRGAVDPHLYHYRLLPRIWGLLGGKSKVLDREQTHEMLRLNHYRTKSQEDFLTKGEVNARGYLAGKETPKRFERLNRTHNQETNKDILRFVEPLKRRMNQQSIS